MAEKKSTFFLVMNTTKQSTTYPFGSTVGIGRADPEWARKNRVTERCGKDRRRGQPAATLKEGVSDILDETFDWLIVGAGLSGSVIARKLADAGQRCLVIDKREHIGGNCYDYTTSEGIRMSKYGAHLFHTKFEDVWNFVLEHSEWIPFEHRVLGRVRDSCGVEQIVPIPPTAKTVRMLFGDDVSTESDMVEWYRSETVYFPSPMNGEEAALSRVGSRLYEKIFKHYTKKQWDKYPRELDASVLKRLPCRTSSDDRYFDDEFQALPAEGYTRMFENMLLDDKLIEVRVGVDFFKDSLPAYKRLIYTGPVDAYFSQRGLPKLEYRSLRFEYEWVPEVKFFQEAMVVNYPSAEVPFTRIVEYKHLPNQPHDSMGTYICREYSSSEGDPYYPVPNDENKNLYNKYRAMAEKEEDVIFTGRLASYKYFNMDEAIQNALEVAKSLVQ